MQNGRAGSNPPFWELAAAARLPFRPIGWIAASPTREAFKSWTPPSRERRVYECFASEERMGSMPVIRTGEKAMGAGTAPMERRDQRRHLSCPGRGGPL